MRIIPSFSRVVSPLGFYLSAAYGCAGMAEAVSEVILYLRRPTRNPERLCADGESFRLAYVHLALYFPARLGVRYVGPILQAAILSRPRRAGLQKRGGKILSFAIAYVVRLVNFEELKL